VFNPRERSRPSVFLAFLFVAYLLLCGIASAAPSITLSKKSGPPTSKILVSGRGFKSHVGVDIFFNTKDKALVVTNGKGEFHDATVHAPRSARPGEHWITALERNNDKGAQKPFLVQTDWSEFHFEAAGTRLNPYENVLNVHNVRTVGLKWSYKTGSEVLSSPAVVNGVVYIGSDDGNFYALNASNGSKLWSYPIVAASPAVADGVVYVGGLYSVYALNAHTGAKLWSYLTQYYVASSPAVVKGVVYVGSRDGHLYALNVRTGSKVWSFATLPVDSSPAVANGVVYFGAGNVYALNASTGALLWTVADYVFGSPAVANGVVYVGSNDDNVYALNASTGAVLWSYPTGSYVGYSSAAVANGVVYIGSQDGKVYALNAKSGHLLWSSTTGYFLYSAPAVANGVVYVGAEDNNVYALNARTGDLLWSYTTGYEVFSSAAVVNGVVYVGSEDFSVYAFGLKHDGDRTEEDSKHPDPKTLRPDFSLKVSESGS
jgi:outer membrane protein assembly factor BamB